MLPRWATRQATRQLPGPPTDVICPQCGGSLWELEDRKITRYECHVGHSYTAETLLEDENGELEEALWAALRALEEGAELRRRMARRLRGAPATLQSMREKLQQEAAQSETRATVLRELLVQSPAVAEMARSAGAEDKAKSARTQRIGKRGTGGRMNSTRPKGGAPRAGIRAGRRTGRNGDSAT